MEAENEIMLDKSKKHEFIKYVTVNNDKKKLNKTQLQKINKYGKFIQIISYLAASVIILILAGVQTYEQLYGETTVTTQLKKLNELKSELIPYNYLHNKYYGSATRNISYNLDIHDVHETEYEKFIVALDTVSKELSDIANVTTNMVHTVEDANIVFVINKTDNLSYFTDKGILMVLINDNYPNIESIGFIETAIRRAFMNYFGFSSTFNTKSILYKNTTNNCLFDESDKLVIVKALNKIK